jgi:hypothetical protein
MATTTITLPMFTQGTKSWLESSVEFASTTLLYIDKDARQFYDTARELIDNKAWELYFNDEPKTWERFLKEALGVEDVEDTLTVLRGVELAIESGFTGPVSAKQARDQFLVKNAPAVGKHGGDRVNTEQGDGGNLGRQRGNSLEYQAGRLKRDRPDLAEQVEQGKLLLREATDEAGITKPATKYWRVPKNIESLATYIKNKFTQDEIQQLLEELTK